MIISSDLEFFQTVYLKTDSEQSARLVTKVEVSPGNVLIYQLSCGTVFSNHYRDETSTNKDELKAVID